MFETKTDNFEEACERLFKEHKDLIVVPWRDYIFDIADAKLLNTAKDYLVKNKVIKSSGKVSGYYTTEINHDVINADNFKDAIKIIKSNDKQYESLIFGGRVKRKMRIIYESKAWIFWLLAISVAIGVASLIAALLTMCNSR